MYVAPAPVACSRSSYHGTSFAAVSRLEGLSPCEGVYQPLDQLRTQKSPQGSASLPHFDFDSDGDASPGPLRAPSITPASRALHSSRTHSCPPSRLPASLHPPLARLHEHRGPPFFATALLATAQHALRTGTEDTRPRSRSLRREQPRLHRPPVPACGCPRTPRTTRGSTVSLHPLPESLHPTHSEYAPSPIEQPRLHLHLCQRLPYAPALALSPPPPARKQRGVGSPPSARSPPNLRPPRARTPRLARSHMIHRWDSHCRPCWHCCRCPCFCSLSQCFC
jgi:hypothetical protein